MEESKIAQLIPRLIILAERMKRYMKIAYNREKKKRMFLVKQVQ
jgi:hypothetical protein